MANILVTGAAGFIGAALVNRILENGNGDMVIGVDNINDYYDVELKKYRLSRIEQKANCIKRQWSFIKGDISNNDLIQMLFEKYKFDIVVNLAAQAGVRYSISNPRAYVDSNIVGFFNILEACRNSQNKNRAVKHLVYASSSSVYGGNEKVPFNEKDNVDCPVSLYAATKKSNELFAHAYSKLYDIPTTGLRFFTVYGPAGRPDMAYFSFTDKLMKGKDIQIFNHGKMKRDFTYIDDIVDGIMKVMEQAPERKKGDDGLPVPPYKVYNIGHGSPVDILEFVEILQKELILAGVLPDTYDFETHKKYVGMQSGDVPITYADTSALEHDFDYKPLTDLNTGIRNFAVWYKAYYIDGRCR